jgi:hypothetical protein
MTEEHQSNEVQEEETQASTPTESLKKKSEKPHAGNKVLWIIILILIVLAGGYYALGKYDLLPTKSDGAVVDGGATDTATVVATVNGVTISRGELNEKIEQVQQSIPEGVPDPTQDAAFELQLLDDLINLKLLTMEAESRNYTVTEEEIEAEKQILIEQFGGEEIFQLRLNTFGITEEELNENMRVELLIRQLLEDETDIELVEVTDAEIQDTYDSAVATVGDQAPPLESVKEMIRAELTNQKSAELVNEYIEALRAESNIEKTL